MKGPSSPILLDAWAARSCPVKTQNAYTPPCQNRSAIRVTTSSSQGRRPT